MRSAAIPLWALLVLACAGTSVKKEIPPDDDFPEGDASVEHVFQEQAEMIIMARAWMWVDDNKMENGPAIKQALLMIPRPTVYWSVGKCQGHDAIEYKGRCFHGIMWNWNRIYVRAHPRIADSAFVHEMSHAYRQLLLGSGDAGHSDADWWKYFSTDTNEIVRVAEQEFFKGAGNGSNQQGIRDK